MKIKQKQLVLSLVSLFGAVSLAYADGARYEVAYSNEPVVDEPVLEEEKPILIEKPQLEVSDELACVEDDESCRKVYYPLYLNLLLAAADLVLGLGNDTEFDPKIEYPATIHDISKIENNFTYNPSDHAVSPLATLLPSSIVGPSSLSPSLSLSALSISPSILPFTVPSVMSSNASLVPLSIPLLSSLAPFNLSSSLAVEPLLSSITPFVTSSTSSFSNPSQPSSGPSNSLLAPLTSSLQPLFSSSLSPSTVPSSSLGTSLMSLLGPLLTSSSIPSIISLAPLSSIPPFSLSMDPSKPSSSLGWYSLSVPLYSLSSPLSSSSLTPSLLPLISSGVPLAIISTGSSSSSSAPSYLSIAPLSSIPPFSLSMDPSQSITSGPVYSSLSSSSTVSLPSLTSLAAPFVILSSGPIGSLLSSSVSLATMPIWGPLWSSSSLPGLSSLPSSLPGASSGLPLMSLGTSLKSLAFSAPSSSPLLSNLALSSSYSILIPSSLISGTVTSLLLLPFLIAPSVASSLPLLYVSALLISSTATLSSIPSSLTSSFVPFLLSSTSLLLNSGLSLASSASLQLGSSLGSSLAAPLLSSSAIPPFLSSIFPFVVSSIPVSLLAISSVPTLLSGLSFIAFPVLALSSFTAVLSLSSAISDFFVSGAFGASASTSISSTITSSFYPLIASFIFGFGSSAAYSFAVALALLLIPTVVLAPSIWGGGVSLLLGAVSSILSGPFLLGSIPSLISAPSFAPVGSSLFSSSVPSLFSGSLLTFSGFGIGTSIILGSTAAIIALAWVPILGGLLLGFSSMPWIWVSIYFTVGAFVWIPAIMLGGGASLFSSTSSSFLIPLTSSVSVFSLGVVLPLVISSSMIPSMSSQLPLILSNFVTSVSFSVLAPASLSLFSLSLPSALSFTASSTVGAVFSSSAISLILSSIPSLSLALTSLPLAPLMSSVGGLSFSLAFLSSLSPSLSVFSSALSMATSVFGLSSIPASLSISLAPSSSSIPLGLSSALNYLLSSGSSLSNSSFNVLGVASSSVGLIGTIASSSIFPLNASVQTVLGSSSSLSLTSLTFSNNLTSALYSATLLSFLLSSGTIFLGSSLGGLSILSGLTSSSLLLPFSVLATFLSLPIASSSVPALAISSSGLSSLVSSFPVSWWLTSAGSIPGASLMGAAVAGSLGVYYLSLYGGLFFVELTPFVAVSGFLWPLYLVGSASFPSTFPFLWATSIFSAEASVESIFSILSIPSSWNPSSNGSFLTAPSASLMSISSAIFTISPGVPLSLLTSSLTLPTSGLIGLYVAIAGAVIGYFAYIGVFIAVAVGVVLGITLGPLAISLGVGSLLFSSLTGIFTIGSSSFLPFASTVSAGISSSAMISLPSLLLGSGIVSFLSGTLSIPLSVMSTPLIISGISILSTPSILFSVPSSLLGASSAVFGISSSVGNSLSFGLLLSTSLSYTLSSLSNSASLSILPSLSSFPLTLIGIVSLLPSWASSSVTGSLGTISSSLSLLNLSWLVSSSFVIPLSSIPSVISSGLVLSSSLVSNPLTSSITLPLSSIIGPISSGLPSYLSGVSLLSLGLSSFAPLSSNPSSVPSSNPSSNPSSAPFSNPSLAPFSNPSLAPLSNPLLSWFSNPSVAPSVSPPSSLSTNPSSMNPSSNPSTASISNPSSNPSSAPFSNPALSWLSNPSSAPFSNPSSAPFSNPSLAPSFNPLTSSSVNPSSMTPSTNPSSASISNPSLNPSSAPLSNPLLSSSSNPSSAPLSNPLLSLFSNPLLAPISNPISSSSNPLSWPSSGPLSISSNPLSSSISNPVSLSSNPSSSSLPSSLSNPSSWAGVLSNLPSLPSVMIAGPAMSSKFSGIGNKKNNRASYYIPGYDFTLNKKDFEFRNVVTFGDSLSDTGSAGRGGIYMADGNPFSFYNSYLSIYLTGKFNAPRGQNGTNYAVSGALVKWASNPLQLLGDPLAIMRSKMSQQIEYYLSDNGEVADPGDIFVLWGGGNDMTGDMMQAAMPWNWSKVISSNGGYLDNKPAVLGSYAQTLSDKGAQNIFTLGLPDPGLAPFSGSALIGATLGSMGLLTDGTPLEFLNPGNWILGMMDDYLRNNANLVGSPVGNADEYFIDNYARMYHHFVPFIPTELWRWAVVIPAQLQRNLVIRWNNDLQNRLRDVNGNVVYADMYRLYEEVQNNPYVYGFTNTLVAQCTLGKESTICDAEDSYYHGDDGQVYMYTDWHHPSPQMNQIIAEYLLTIFNAPGYVSGLSRVSEMNEGVRANFMKNEMKYMRFDERAVGEFTTFASVLAGVDKNSRSLNPRNLSTQGIGTGFAYRAAEGLDVGASLALTYGDKHPSNQLKYRDSLQVLTGFIQYRDPNGFWGNGQVYTGWEQMNDIKRSMQFLKHVRTEQGETEGKISGFGLSLGYDILLSENGCNTCTTHWYATPYVGGSVTKYKVKGYQEEGNSSTAMEFKEQVRTDKLGTLGVQIVSKSPKLNTNLDLAYTRAFDHEEFKVEGRLKNFAKDFHRSDKGISKERKGWVSLTPSVEYKLNDQFSVYGNINYNYGNNKFTQLNGSIGIRSKF